MKKKTVVLGASTNAERYSYKAVTRLHEHGHPVVPVGIRQGSIAGIDIVNGKPSEQDVDTVSVYLSPKIQEEYKDYILELHPKRIIFNPGTENEEMEAFFRSNDIEVEEACTLVLLSTNAF